MTRKTEMNVGLLHRPHVRTSLVAVAALVALLLTAGCSGSGTPDAGATVSSGRFEASAITPPKQKPNFTLTDTKGRPFNFRRQTDGGLTLLYFGYTHCPDVCPINMAQIHAVLNSGNLGIVKVVFVTVDPARDTRSRLRHWLDQIDPSFIGLTGTQAQIQAAERAAGVPIAVKSGTGSNYSMGHAAQVLSYAPDNRSYVQFPFGTRQSAYAHDLQVLEDIPPATTNTSSVSTTNQK